MHELSNVPRRHLNAVIANCCKDYTRLPFWLVYGSVTRCGKNPSARATPDSSEGNASSATDYDKERAAELRMPLIKRELLRN